MLNINDLTLGQAKDLAALMSGGATSNGLNSMLGEKVIVRTYAAGVFFGELIQKSGKEVILKNARRMWSWKVREKTISLSGCALHGVDYENSKIVEPVALIWLEAIEIILCTPIAIKSLEDAPHVIAE